MLTSLFAGGSGLNFPRQFGKYELVEQIAIGGMAEVFRAIVRGAEGFQREVCIKRILPMFSEDPDFVAMFIDEATLASKLHHANIVQIFDFDKIDGQYYIAMELVEGGDLKRLNTSLRLLGRPFPLELATFIGAELLKGLHYAHTRRVGGQSLGIIHRDISPHNVLVSTAGEVKITDFGIAKAASRAAATRSGVVKGKIVYMSPEQAMGEPVDQRSDLFSVGIVLYELATARRPFVGDSDAETLALIQRGEFLPARSFRKDISERLDGVICRLMARSLGDRFSSGGDALRELAGDVPADGAMKLEELIHSVEPEVNVPTGRIETEILDVAMPKVSVVEAPVLPASSAAVTRTRGPRAEPEALGYVNTAVATPTPSRDRPPSDAATTPRLNVDWPVVVPTDVCGPPEMDLCPTSVGLDPTSPGTPSTLLIPTTSPDVEQQAPVSEPTIPNETTPAAWTFSAELTGASYLRPRRSRARMVAVVGLLVAIAAVGVLLALLGPEATPPAPAPAPSLLPPVSPSFSPAFSPSGEAAGPAIPPDGAADQVGVSARPNAPLPRRAVEPRPRYSPTKNVTDLEREVALDPSSAALGTLYVNVRPWARVRIGGRTYSQTPIGPIQVPAGAVRIVLERDGRPPMVRTEQIQAGDVRRLSYEFP